ncbi:MAG: formate dehydrogenase accessory sulfurtransferase FdhD [Gammaproteobacteria bacterium]|nr:formate dehydrogenase accessory sulfurtransferase FdhD [Gammaproteobacteria bacterium]
MAKSSRNFDIEKTDGRDKTTIADAVAVEEPLEIQVMSSAPEAAAAKSVSITMRTPGNDEELAVGFLFTEGIVANRSQVLAVNAIGQADEVTGLRNTIRLEMSPDTELDLASLERHFYTTSSCGVCGKASLDALQVSGLQSLADIDTQFEADMLLGLPDRVRELQPVFVETGGLHAAAVFGPDGEIHVVREDVGRHNATDKVIGALLQAGEVPGHRLGLFVSGRASFELMQKALVAGIPLMAAVGAPSSLAVDTAREFGMTLVGFLRDGTFNIYAGGERIT